jgi:hypothetical protein
LIELQEEIVLMLVPVGNTFGLLQCDVGEDANISGFEDVIISKYVLQYERGKMLV